MTVSVRRYLWYHSVLFFSLCLLDLIYMYVLRDSLYFVFFVESVGHSYLIFACDITSRADTRRRLRVVSRREHRFYVCMHFSRWICLA